MKLGLVLAALATFAAAGAHAAPAVGVVVTGDEALRSPVDDAIHAWLDHHGRAVAQVPLDDDAVTTIASCFLAGDPECARVVVDARAKTKSIVYAHVEKAASGDLVITAYWFVKGHEPAAEHRVCEHCDDDGWHALITQVIDGLASASKQTGRLELRSRPTGAAARIDDADAGVTPIDRELAVGPHAIALVQDGRVIAERDVEIAGGETTHVVLKARAAQSEQPSRAGPLVLLGAGVATLATGLGFIYVGERDGPDQKYIYPDSTPIGIGLATIGVGLAIGGVVLLAQSGRDHAPVVAISPHASYFGWLTRF